MEKFKVLGFGHVGISVRDVEKSRKFYENILGFRTVWERYNEKGDLELLFIGNKSCVIEFLDAERDRVDGHNGPINHLSILVDDIEAAVAELKIRPLCLKWYNSRRKPISKWRKIRHFSRARRGAPPA